ncbi:MAG: TerC/Alx family metal homeostasis membrane protein [Parachlamydiales bacterium]|jgi:tellurite resistance protein TerC
MIFSAEVYPWIIFHILIIIAIAIDLLVSPKMEGKNGIKFSLYASLAWITVAVLYGFWIWEERGPIDASNYFTGYLVEKALSVDNLFVFLVLFRTFKTPEKYRRKVLFWGVIGAVLMRAIFIFVGIALIKEFSWILDIFAVFLLVMSYKLLFKDEQGEIPKVVDWLQSRLRVTSGYRNGHWLVKENGKLYATPLLVVLLAIELTDVVFAIDSIPAVMGITQDPYIVYTSNIFAVLGLRALYFAMSSLLELFHYLNQGLAIILFFIAVKIFMEGYYHVPNLISLSIVALVLTLSAVASLVFPKKE